MEQEKSHLFDKPRNVRRVQHSLYFVCAALIAVDFVFDRHVSHPWESLWGFYGIYGFVACVILVLAAKEMRKLLMRKEDYYDVDD